ncbi:alpha/beta hydrolase [Micromonospora lupini]|uniref:alpha/beta fold hydrolase n=1 Tax=Micromonospora lupini TaxID=285679 RepID=UPI003402A1BE
MATTAQILFVQGAGTGTHDEWDNRLCDSLRRELGDSYEVRYPRMPDEAAPFVGAGGWPGDEFELPHDLGARLPRGVPVRVFHGLGDETAPPSHADLYAGVIPQARVYRLPGRDHQLNDDLGDVAAVIKLGDAPAGPGRQGASDVT